MKKYAQGMSGGLVALLAVAQGRAADSTIDTGGQLEEIVITAQKRVQNLQEVPISAQVVSSATLVTQNLDSLTTLSQTIPSIQVSPAGRGDNLYIRGIGSNQGQSFDQAVGLFIDDIYHGRSRISASTFLDLDRVEVLKGPQSIFFGNNAIAGAVNIVARKPTDSFEATARLLYGQHGQYAVEGTASGPLTNTLSARIALTANGLRGWMDNINTGDKAPDENNGAARVTLLYKPTENFDATLKVEGAKNRNDSGLFLQLNNCPPPAPYVTAGFCTAAIGSGVTSAIGPTLTNIGVNSHRYNVSSGQAIDLSTSEEVLTVNNHQWGHTFTSVSGFYNYHYNLNLDGDTLPVTLLNVQAPEKYSQFSQELRVASPTGQTLEYLAGLYFQTDDLHTSVNQSYFFLTPTINGLPPFAPAVPYLPLGQGINYAQREHKPPVRHHWNVTDHSSRSFSASSAKCSAIAAILSISALACAWLMRPVSTRLL